MGRVRVALDGVNATLGGSMRRLRQHIAMVQASTLILLSWLTLGSLSWWCSVCILQHITCGAGT